jgi:HK97 family phage prohead protease
MPQKHSFPEAEGIQRRTFSADAMRIETRAEKPPQIIGHAALFDSRARIGWSFYEEIAPGAFSKTIQEADVRCLFNHDINFILGRTKSGTLRLSEDADGLVIDCDPPETDLIRDLVLAPIRRGDVDQMSFAFDAVRTEWIDQENDLPIRRLLEVKLYDVSPVTYPAYEDTDVAVRSALANAGIDYLALTQAIERSKRGAITDADRALVRSVISKLNGLLPPAPTESHPGEDDEDARAKVRMADVRRRLELAEIEL